MGLVLLGRSVDSQIGWIPCSARVAALPGLPGQGKRWRLPYSVDGRLRPVWHYVSCSWHQPCVHSLFLYDLHQMPMTWLCRGYSVHWPVALEADHVPNL
jgi:hypothetical protein